MFVSICEVIGAMRCTVTLSPKVGCGAKASPEGVQPERPYSKSQLSGRVAFSGSGTLTSQAGPRLTITAKLLLEMFPAWSPAVQLTTFVPMGKNEPEGGVHTTVGHGSTLSLAVTVKFRVRPARPSREKPLQSTLMV